jgi:hypothetical protein
MRAYGGPWSLSFIVGDRLGLDPRPTDPDEVPRWEYYGRTNPEELTRWEYYRGTTPDG